MNSMRSENVSLVMVIRFLTKFHRQCTNCGVYLGGKMSAWMNGEIRSRVR